MTFYEAALRVLEGEGRPLNFLEITEKSISQNLLSHVGKMPEQTMLSRLAAMARRTRDRRVMVTAKDTFALTDWALPEDADALAQTGIPEENPEESLPPLRGTERHPEPRSDLVRSAGRSERKGRHDEGEARPGKRRRYPPLSEVAFEILTDQGQEGMTAEALLEKARGRELASQELAAETLLTALLEDNQRRIDAGRRPQFLFAKDTRVLTLERAGSPSDAPPLELQAAFAEALGIPLEGGRPVLPQRSGSASEPEAVEPLFSAAKSAVKEARRASARQLRMKLAEGDVGILERASVRMLHGLSFRELKVAKRSKDGPLLTARRREGSTELRYAVRILRASAPLDRRTVQDLRRDLGHYSAHLGILISPQEARGDAKSESQSGGALVLLWCGDGLGEKFLEAKSGVKTIQLEMFELDEGFFDEARRDAIELQKRREERHREREQTRPERSQAAEVEASPISAAGSEVAPAGGDDAGDDDDGDDDLEAAKAFVAGSGPNPAGAEASGEAAAASGRRRRRRRRGRRGRGPRPEGGGGSPPPTPTPEGG